MDQQFRLKWNNHCNTLLQVFGNLLKTETLVDCTIGADGQYLKAHKVVVSACSPYFQSLFTEHFDKHPIIILKDIKFAELQSMIDYMYEGEVNISQDQLPSFLKAAASIQLKGLTQNVKSEAPPPPQSPPSSKPPLPQLNSARGGMLSNGSLTPSSMLNVELEEGQQRKKRKLGATGTEPSSASSSPSLVPDLVTPSVILDVPGENTGAGATVGQNGQGGGGGQSGDGGLMKKEPSEYSGRSEDEEEDGMSHDGWDLSNDGLHDSNSTMSAGDRTGQGPGGLHHNTPAGGMRPAGGPGGLSAAGGPDMSNVDENNQAKISLVPIEKLTPITDVSSNISNSAAQLSSTPMTDLSLNISNTISAEASLDISNPASAQSVLDFEKEELMNDVYNKAMRKNFNDTGVFRCPIPSCDRVYSRRRSLSRHRQECGQLPRFHCSMCPYKSKRRDLLKSHMKHGHKLDHVRDDQIIVQKGSPSVY